MLMRGWQTMPTALAMSPQVEQEFAIALSAQDRRRDLASNVVPLLLGVVPELAEHPKVLFRVAHDAALPHRPFANLELGFDERDDVTRRAEELSNAWQHQAKGDERDIDHGQIRRERQAIQMPDVDPLQDRDPGILAKTPGQLPVADVDGDHPGGPPL